MHASCAAERLTPGLDSRTRWPAHLLVNERGDGQAVEAVRERLPEPDVVPPLALVVEAVYPVDGRALVVASQEEEILWVLHLQTTQRRSSSESCTWV